MHLDHSTLTQYQACGALVALALIALVVIVLVERHQIDKAQRKRKSLAPRRRSEDHDQ